MSFYTFKKKCLDCASAAKIAFMYVNMCVCVCANISLKKALANFPSGLLPRPGYNSIRRLQHYQQAFDLWCSQSLTSGHLLLELLQHILHGATLEDYLEATIGPKCRRVLEASRVAYVIPLLHELCWLLICFWVQFKVLLITFKALYDMDTRYPWNCIFPIGLTCPTFDCGIQKWVYFLFIYLTLVLWNILPQKVGSILSPLAHKGLKSWLWGLTWGLLAGDGWYTNREGI